MGRLEPLASLALGRVRYEDEVVYNADAVGESSQGQQQYNERGHPRNQETKRRERDHVRAANEVMQVTGVVEDSIAAKVKATKDIHAKNHETFTGLRLIELGRVVLIGGVWGVLGLRRRILLYKSYSRTSVYSILRQEASTYSISHICFAGFPSVIACHAAEWAQFLAETVLDAVFDEDEKELPPDKARIKSMIRSMLDFTFPYISVYLRGFAILQQLNLVSSSRLLPTFMTFIPFSADSPLALPPNPHANAGSILSWGSALFVTAAPLFVMLAHGKLKFAAKKILYRPVYTLLPRPIGESMFSGMDLAGPLMEYDTPDTPIPAETITYRSEDEHTLRALEGLPTLERAENQPPPVDQTQDSSDDEDDEVAQPTFISFDVEATETMESPHGTWSAELRSAQDPNPPGDIRYRITGLTMLPPILATEGLREIVAAIVVMPLEALMVRLVAGTYRTSVGLGTSDLYPIRPRVRGFGNVLVAITMQLAVTGVVWAGFTVSTQMWAAMNRAQLAEKAEDGGPPN